MGYGVGPWGCRWKPMLLVSVRGHHLSLEGAWLLQRPVYVDPHTDTSGGQGSHDCQETILAHSKPCRGSVDGGWGRWIVRISVSVSCLPVSVTSWNKWQTWWQIFLIECDLGNYVTILHGLENYVKGGKYCLNTTPLKFDRKVRSSPPGQMSFKLTVSCVISAHSMSPADGKKCHRLWLTCTRLGVIYKYSSNS